ncbi:hypothetical protein JOD67_003220 [Tenggerimyces flavus]|nr:hypothetical protein [Tenggerimyces flavus]MBM7786540.1 hypothetical protein [Tenggerimyces flavus]
MTDGAGRSTPSTSSASVQGDGGSGEFPGCTVGEDVQGKRGRLAAALGEPYQLTGVVTTPAGQAEQSGAALQAVGELIERLVSCGSSGSTRIPVTVR